MRRFVLKELNDDDSIRMVGPRSCLDILGRMMANIFGFIFCQAMHQEAQQAIVAARDTFGGVGSSHEC